ncbi:hypothetical protein CLOM_g2900 [Closterium sp. NIES-68]|nr:hypothetical protein CLOM_g2900 [Closterium sp. NIES-68]GJP79086.1 hypothetical protein CLOP_g9330 [Closterium sp. NIES-67]
MPPRVAGAPSAQQVYNRLADLLLVAAHEPSAALAGVQQRVRKNVPTVVNLKSDTLSCMREAEFACADVADCHVIARTMTGGGPAAMQRMLARLAAAKPHIPSLRAAKDVKPTAQGSAEGVQSRSAAADHRAHSALHTLAAKGVQARSAATDPHSPGDAEAAAPRTAEAAMLPRVAVGGGEDADEEVRACSGNAGSGNDLPQSSPRARPASDCSERVGGSWDMVDRGRAQAEVEGMARKEGADVVRGGGGAAGAGRVVDAAGVSSADVASAASSGDVAAAASSADVAGAATADRAAFRRALTGPEALLAFINEGVEDGAEDAHMGDAQTSMSSRLLRLISPPRLVWQSKQTLQKKEPGASSDFPCGDGGGNKIGDKQRLRLEAWLDDN